MRFQWLSIGSAGSSRVDSLLLSVSAILYSLSSPRYCTVPRRRHRRRGDLYELLMRWGQPVSTWASSSSSSSFLLDGKEDHYRKTESIAAATLRHFPQSPLPPPPSSRWHSISFNLFVSSCRRRKEPPFFYSLLVGRRQNKITPEKKVDRFIQSDDMVII